MELRSFLKASAIYGLGILLQQVIGVFLLPLYTHYLAPADYGVLEILDRSRELVMVTVIAALTLTVISLYQAEAERRDKLRVAGNALTVALTAAPPLMLIVVLLAGPISRLLFGGPEYAGLVWKIAVVLVCDAVGQIAIIFWQARLQATLYVTFSVLMPAMRALIILGFVAGLHWGLDGVMWGWLLNSAFFAVVLALMLVRQLSPASLTPDWPLLRRMARFAWPFVPGGVMGFVIQSGDRYFLLRFGTRSDVGVYGIGYRLGAIVALGLLGPFNKVWSATMIELGKTEDGRRKLVRLSRGFFTLFGLGTLGFGLFVREGLAVLASPEYYGALPIVYIMIAAQLFYVWNVMLDANIYIVRRSDLKMLVNALGCGVVLVLYTLLIPRWLGLGAAAATFGAFLAMAVFTFFMGRRVGPVPFSLRGPTVTVALTIACLAGAWALRTPDGFIPWPAKIGFVALYLALSYFFRILDPSDVRDLLRAVRPGAGKDAPAAA